jgi:hypothetical protein
MAGMKSTVFACLSLDHPKNSRKRLSPVKILTSGCPLLSL